MKKIFKILFLIFFSTSLFALDFKVATYNVENLFDLKYDGTEYKEYKPNSKYWHKKAFNNKIQNITRVIKDLDADILSLQEIESQEALEILLKKLPKYKYSFFLKNKDSAIGVAIVSKFKIIKNEKIITDKFTTYSRPILKSTININNKKLIIYSNHWKSKRTAESTRIPYAQSLKRNINTLNNDEDYIILGDLNSNYDEYITFANDKKLNDTYGITGINQVLNTSINGNFIKKKDILKQNSKNVLYNLWLDIPNKQNRFSSSFRKHKNTPDNMLVSYALFDKKNISYINNSFEVFKPSYLYKHKINRWNKKKYNGYSDHLPIFARFSTEVQTYIIKNKVLLTNNIDILYEKQKLHNSIKVHDAIVLYKSKNKAIIKAKNSRAILIYKNTKSLKLGYKYDLEINEIKNYNGLQEITNFKILKEKEYDKNYEDLFISKDTKNILSVKYQNEVLKDIKGLYKNKHLHTSNQKLYLYFNKNIKKPKNNEYIKIIHAPLSIYKSKIQIAINKQSDFKVINR
jgi:endonuclease/exonuclease/phosphatase family metal-dependent hydrolase